MIEGNSENIVSTAGHYDGFVLKGSGGQSDTCYKM